MSVYFVQAGENGPVKIGYTESHRSVKDRVATLQIGHPKRLRVLSVIHGGKDVERALHKRFASSHLRGEWFKPSVGVLSMARDPAVFETDAKLAEWEHQDFIYEAPEESGYFLSAEGMTYLWRLELSVSADVRAEIARSVSADFAPEDEAHAA